METEISKYPNLKKRFYGFSTQPVWSLDNLKDGFRKFFDEKSHYPTAFEIDDYEYLPSSRQLQRVFGGLVNVRKVLNLEIVDYGRGEQRSKIAKQLNTRGCNSERLFEKMLIAQFGEHFVHVEKLLFNNYYDDSRRMKSRADFYVYAQNYTFCVDVFYSDDIRNVTNIINIKSKSYNGLNIDVYLVNLSETGITQEVLDERVARKTKILDANIKVMTKSSFISHIAGFKRLYINNTFN